jgi:class 3 adenylate cyclase/DNA-binding CsgD family transcriptional regulator/predicted ATPase/ABC-type transport system involved in cytochrome c biogenesis ATPase subunit
MHHFGYCNCSIFVIIRRQQDAHGRSVVAQMAPKREHLSLRERQIAEAYAAGRSHREIAERLFIAPATVRTHLGTIYRKLGVSTKIELLRILETADGPDAGAGVEAFAPSPQTAREPHADPAVTGLLRELGLHQYANVFAANAVDVDVLMTLTDGDLRELGVQAIGHRRRLLDAIHERRSGSVRADGVEGVASAEVLPAPATGPPAERRHLTIALVDLAGSMGLSTLLDPEQMQELLAGYQKAVAKMAARFQGHLANVMGDEILVSFGWPNAHEDDAERAVRASLAIRAAIEALRGPPGNPLAVRIGIASGLVVVGEGMSREAVLAGDAPNLASRLRAIASPGQIVIGESTRRLLSDIFELADLGTKSVRGTGEPVQAFAVIDERSVESRFDARSGSALLPMVGRVQELALLLERWAQAKAGEGQGVLLVGEAGIGKSRIARALLDAVAEEPHTRIRYQCSPYHIDSALWPVVQQLTHAAGIKAPDPDEAKLDKLEALLRQAGDHTLEVAPLIADLIGLDGAPRYGRLELTPQAQRARTLQALVGQLLGLAASRPVLVVLEDAHLIDPSTVELIEQCLDRITDARAMILLTSRPDRQPELVAHPHVTRLTLNRLGRAGVEAMVVRLGGEHLPGDVIGTIIARTDGVPLFVEELTKTVLESGRLRDAGDRWELSGPLPPLAIPATLHDSLMARLDRLAPVKEVAQISAAIGREFSHELVTAVADRSGADLDAALDQLVASELVFRRGTPPEATYSFKHALVQDAAYQSLLKSRRQQLHAQIARVLAHDFPSAAEHQPEVLAHHFTLAGLAKEAIGYWQQAGELSARSYANVEAIAHLTKALELIRTLPASVERDHQELELLTLLGPLLAAVKGYSAGEVETTYLRAEELCRDVGDARQLFQIVFGLRSYYEFRGELRKARAAAERCLGLAQELSDPELLAASYRAVGGNAHRLGEFAAARAHLEQSIAIGGSQERQPDPVRNLADARAVSRVYLSRTLAPLGYPDQALRTSDEALAMAERLAHPYTSAEILHFASGVRLLLRDPAGTRRLAERLIALCREHGFGLHLAHGMLWRGWAVAHELQREDGIEEIRASLTQFMAIGSTISHTHGLIILADARCELHQGTKGLAALGEAEAAIGRTDERRHDAEVGRLRGELTLLLPDCDQAEAAACFRSAIEVAAAQRAKLWELRATTSLARLWADQGRRRDASDLLASVYAWFAEGFDTADLKDAKALLDELR